MSRILFHIGLLCSQILLATAANVTGVAAPYTISNLAPRATFDGTFNYQVVFNPSGVASEPAFTAVCMGFAQVADKTVKEPSTTFTVTQTLAVATCQHAASDDTIVAVQIPGGNWGDLPLGEVDIHINHDWVVAGATTHVLATTRSAISTSITTPLLATGTPWVLPG